MSPRLQFGWGVPPGANFLSLPLPHPTFLRELSRHMASVEAGFDSAWVIDHLQFDTTDVLEGWSTLAYLMGQYPTLHFGNMVLSQSFRNPALLAKMAASLQYLSGNRLYLGIGAGWKEDEYQAYGYEFPPPNIRVEQLGEALQIIRALWTDGPATFEGRHYRIASAWCQPRPEVAPPIMVGGKRPRMLRLIARHADWWNVDWATLDECRSLVQEMERACVEVARDPATLRRTWFGWAVCAASSEEARAIAGNNSGLIGTPGEVVGQIREYIELGFDYFVCASPRFPDPTTLRLFATEVIPVLRADYGKDGKELA